MSCDWRGHCDEAPPVHRLRYSFRHHRYRCGHGLAGEWVVVMVSASTIQHGGVGRLSMASLGATPSFLDYHQAGAVCSASRRLRHTRVYPYEFQFAEVPHPRQRPVRALSSQVAIRTGHPIHAVQLALGLVQHLPTHMVSELRCRRYLAQSLRLSSSRSLDGSKTIEKAFGDGRISFGGQRIVFLG